MRAVSLFLILLSFTGVANAAPADRVASHYIVVTIDEEGSAEPVFYAPVALAQARPSLDEYAIKQALKKAGEDREMLTVRLVQSGRTVYAQVVHVHRELRGEFHGPPVGDGYSIEHFRHRVLRAAAVIRVPVIPETTLEIDGRKASVIHLDTLQSNAAGLPLARVRASQRGQSMEPVGDPGNRMDLLIMGDGYTVGQSSSFAADATALKNAFIADTPHAEYSNFVNVTSLFTASAQSGADHPSYDPSCGPFDLSCCADADASGDPLAGTFVNTAFDARYCAFSIHRLLVVDTAKVLAAAAAVPDWDQIFVIVNDDTYGGSGGLFAVASTHSSAPDLVRHEFGHSFTGLADEYDSPYPGFPACSDINGPPCEANVTDQSNRASIKWAPWIEASTPVPTPEGSGFGDAVGLFEGARYQATGMYRPRDVACLMHYLGVPFGEICAQSYVLRLYDGGWGVPAAGIDVIEPGSEVPPPGTIITGFALPFSVQLLVPAGGPPPTVQWRVDDVIQPGATDSTFTFDLTLPGTYQVELQVTDSTELVHEEMANDSLASSRQWTVEFVFGGLFFDGFESGDTSAWTATSP